MRGYLSIDEVASTLSVEPQIVEQWCQSGQLASILLPSPVNERRVSLDSFEEFLKRNTGTSHTAQSPQQPTPASVQLFVERMLRGIAPGVPIVPVNDYELALMINRPTVQRINAWWSENSDWQIGLQFWPADTVSQSRKFYANVDIESFLALRQDKPDSKEPWQTAPVPHISHVQRHFIYGFAMPKKENGATQEEINAYVAHYITFWHTHQEAIRQYGREEGGGEFAALRALLDKIHPLTPESDGEQAFQTYFVNTKRGTANFSPGLWLGWALTYTEVMQLDAQGRLIDMLRSRINQAMGTWGERLPS